MRRIRPSPDKLLALSSNWSISTDTGAHGVDVYVVTPLYPFFSFEHAQKDW